MTGVGLQVVGRDATIFGLHALDERLDHAAPMYDEIGSYLELRISERFDSETAPDGNPWPKSMRALADGGKTLTDTARLRQSMSRRVWNAGVEVGTNLIYAPPHQFGAVITAKTPKGLRWKFRSKGANADSWARKMSVTIPARPFIGLDDVDAVEIPIIVENYLEGGHAHQ